MVWAIGWGLFCNYSPSAIQNAILILDCLKLDDCGVQIFGLIGNSILHNSGPWFVISGFGITERLRTILGANLGHGFQIWTFTNSFIPFQGLSLAISMGKKLHETNKELSRSIKIVEKKVVPEIGPILISFSTFWLS